MAIVINNKKFFKGKENRRSNSLFKKNDWLTQLSIILPVRVYKNFVALSYEWNTSLPATFHRVVQHFMICTGRQRGTYRTSAELVEDFGQLVDRLEVPEKDQISNLIDTLKHPNMKEIDNQLKSNMENLT